MTTGFSDALALLLQEQVDLAWIYYGWQGIQAKEMGIDLDVVMMKDYFDCVPDFYTPVVIASEATIARPSQRWSKPCLQLCLVATPSQREHPDEAADILLAAVPELDSALVKESQKWLSDYYIAEASRWGEQKESVWQDYADWMVENDVMETPIVVGDAFTNRFLP